MKETLDIVAYTAYLPTAGLDEEFLEEISLLTDDLIKHTSTTSTLLIGLDANCSEKSSPRRKEAFAVFTKECSLKTILPGKEATFHHNNGVSETLDHILCNNLKLVSFLREGVKTKINYLYGWGVPPPPLPVRGKFHINN